MKAFVVVALALLGLAHALPPQLRPKHRLPKLARVEGNFNDYFDEIAPNIRQFIVENGFDPLALPDALAAFNVTDLLGIVWHGELGLTTGWLTDLSLFERSGDALLWYDDLEMNITLNLGFPDLQLTYDYVAQIMDIGPEGTVIGKIEAPVIQITAGAAIAGLQLELYDLSFTDYGQLTVQLEHEGLLLEIIENAILSLVTSLFEGPIMDFIEQTAEAIARELLAQIDIGDIITGGETTFTKGTPHHIKLPRHRPLLNRMLEEKRH